MHLLFNGEENLATSHVFLKLLINLNKLAGNTESVSSVLTSESSLKTGVRGVSSLKYKFSICGCETSMVLLSLNTLFVSRSIAYGKYPVLLSFTAFLTIVSSFKTGVRGVSPLKTSQSVVVKQVWCYH